MFADNTVGFGDVSIFLLVPIGLLLVLALSTWLVMAALRYLWDVAGLYRWRWRWLTNRHPEPAPTVVVAPKATTPRHPPPINWRWAR